MGVSGLFLNFPYVNPVCDYCYGGQKDACCCEYNREQEMTMEELKYEMYEDADADAFSDESGWYYSDYD